MTQFDTKVPTQLVFGPGVLEQTGTHSKSIGSRALVVTSRRAMAQLGYTQRLIQCLKAAAIEATVFNDLGATVSTDDVDRGADAAREFKADLIIGLGGGSVIDCAKAIAAVAPGQTACEEYLYQRAEVTESTLPVVAIPTTAGTGSEMNRSAIITDEAARYKDGLRSDFLFPRIAIVDPTLTYQLPPSVTAQTGFDALAHAVESYVSPKSQPWSDALALEAIQSVVKWLPVVLTDPQHAQAREQLMLAATKMGSNLSYIGTCLPHRLDKPLCALHPEIPHGQAIALFYRDWADFSWPGAPTRFARIAAMLDVEASSWPVERAAAACSSYLQRFIESIGLKTSLAALDVNLQSEDIPFMLAGVRGDLQVNPIPCRTDQVADFFDRIANR